MIYHELRKSGFCTQKVHKIEKRIYSVLRGTLYHHIIIIFVYNLMKVCFNIS